MSALHEIIDFAGLEDEVVRSGQRIYDERLQGILEPSQVGRFVAIEPKTGQYFVGDTGTTALLDARTAMPDSLFYLVRIGYQAADTISGYGGRIR